MKEPNFINPAAIIEFFGCRYSFVQRLKKNICVYCSQSTMLTVELQSDKDPSHQYFVLGMTFVTGHYNPGWDGDGDEYDFTACRSKNQSGYAKPIRK